MAQHATIALKLQLFVQQSALAFLLRHLRQMPIMITTTNATTVPATHPLFISIHEELSGCTRSPMKYAALTVSVTKTPLSIALFTAFDNFPIISASSDSAVSSDANEKLIPQYLRFVKGVIDSQDLSLNVSREILQDTPLVDSIKSGVTKRVLSSLQTMSEKEPEKYQSFWSEFGKVLKEGPAEDFANKESIAKLLRFASSNTDEQSVSFESYIKNMPKEQESIYYITADSHQAAKNSPHLEIFKQKNIEVLLLSDRVDEWLVSSLHEFGGKKLQSIAKGDLDLGKLDTEEQKAEKEKIEKDAKNIVEKIKKYPQSKLA